MNHVQLEGQLTLTPQLSRSTKGAAYCNLRVSTADVVRDALSTEYHDVLAWDQLAEGCSGLRVGDIVHVDGRLHTARRQEDGRSERRTWVVANSISVHRPTAEDRPAAATGGEV